MQSPEFEKKVQQKMEELQFSPSPAVWTQVQNEVRRQQQKQKRRVGLLFFFLLLALALGGVVYLSNSSTSKPKQSSTPGMAGGKSSLADSLPSQSLRGTAAADLPGGLATPTSMSKGVSSLLAKGTVGPPTGGINIMVVADGHSQSGKAATVAASPAPRPETGFVEQGGSKPNTAAPVASPDRKTSGAQQPIHDSSAVPSQSTAAKPAVASPAKQQISKTQQPRPWKFGFIASAGASTSVGPIHHAQIITTPYGSYFSSGTSTLSLVPAPIYAPNAGYGIHNSSPNPTTPKVSFSLGFFAEKSISPRFSLAIGLTYMYNSMQTKTGSHIDSNISVTSNGSGTMTKDGFYQQGTSVSYTTSYHVIQLPLVADYLISKTNKLPLTAELGFSLSEIIGSNALLYDYANMVYFKQSHALNQTQASATAALLVGMRSEHITYRLGPQFQYGMSNLWKPGNGQNQHMLFLGIKLAMIPWQK